MKASAQPLGPALTRLGPELRLLLNCVSAFARWEPTVTLPEAAAVDWQLFLALGRRHALAPLAYHALTHPPAHPRAHPSTAKSSLEPPREAMAELRRQYLVNVGTGIGLTRELSRLLEMLRDDGITAVPFKGPSLAVGAYGDLSLRPFSDLDLFVPRAEVRAAVELLMRDGYRLSGSYGGRFDDAVLRSEYHLTMVRPGGEPVVELHWAFAPSFFAAPTSADLRQNSSVELLGEEVPQFAIEDQILLLCSHGGRHLWQRLGWVCDVALLGAREGVDWDDLLRRAREQGGMRMVSVAVILAVGLLGASLPAGIAVASYGDAVAKRLAGQVIEDLGSVEDDGAINVPRFFLRLHDRPSDRLRLFLYLLRSKVS